MRRDRESAGVQRAVAVTLCLLALATDARPDPPPIVFESDLEIVNVTVTVRDGNGNLIGNLGPDDFSVFEDGRRQTLVRQTAGALFARTLEEGEHDSLALDLGLLLDTSESMLDELKLSQQAAVRFLEAVPRARELYTVFFGDDIRLSRYDSENQQGLIDRIQTAKGGGRTPLYDAIAVYLSRVEGGRGRKALVLFTDGEDSSSTLTETETLRLLRGSGVVAYPIAFLGHFASSASALQARIFLEQAASLTGGQVFRPRTSRDLPAIFQKIIEELSAQYVMGYVSDNRSRDGMFRTLKVEVKGKNLKVRHRHGYYAPSDAPPAKESARAH